MKPNQVDLVAASMSCGLQQIVHALEPRFTGEITGNVCERDGLDCIHDDVAVVHLVAATYPDMGTRPDANAAPDSPAPDALAQAFSEHHVEPHSMATGHAGTAGGVAPTVTAARIPRRYPGRARRP
jgi:hypothetical protein